MKSSVPPYRAGGIAMNGGPTIPIRMRPVRPLPSQLADEPTAAARLRTDDLAARHHEPLRAFRIPLPACSPASITHTDYQNARCVTTRRSGSGMCRYRRTVHRVHDPEHQDDDADHEIVAAR